jgi:hypothetical protein
MLAARLAAANCFLNPRHQIDIHREDIAGLQPIRITSDIADKASSFADEKDARCDIPGRKAALLESVETASRVPARKSMQCPFR